MRFARLRVFITRHKKALLVVALVVASFVILNVGAAVAFRQEVEDNGVRIETDKAVYRMGETVHIRMHIVNRLNYSIPRCFPAVILSVTGGLGLVYLEAGFEDLCNPSPLLPPGSEKLSEGEWRAKVLPSIYTIRAVVSILFTQEEENFTGTTTVLLII